MMDKQNVVAKITEKELERIVAIHSKIEAIKKTIDDLMEMRCELMRDATNWWDEICKKYGLDGSKQYSVKPKTGEIMEIKD